MFFMTEEGILREASEIEKMKEALERKPFPTGSIVHYDTIKHPGIEIPIFFVRDYGVEKRDNTLIMFLSQDARGSDEPNLLKVSEHEFDRVRPARLSDIETSYAVDPNPIVRETAHRLMSKLKEE